MREKTKINENIYYPCIACKNKASYAIKVDFPNEENFGREFYSCDSDNCDALIWLQMASSEEIFDYPIEL